MDTSVPVIATHLSVNGCGVKIDAKSDNTIYGFVMYDLFKQYKLDIYHNYQQYLANEPRFRSYLNLAIHTAKHTFSLSS